MRLQFDRDRERRWWAARLPSTLRLESGQTLVIFALALPVMLGFCAIVVDVGNFFVQKRSLQKTADAAALAGATKLPCAIGNSACITLAGLEAARYSAANGGPASLSLCSGSITTNCYELVSPNKLRVRLQTPVSTFFGGIFGAKQVDVAARSAAVVTSYTTTTPPTVSTNADQVFPPVTNVTTTSSVTGGNPALLFAMSQTCYALNLQGANSFFGGAVVSNAGADAHSSGSGGSGLFYAQSCLNINANLWTTVKQQAVDTNWPVPPPTCTPACNPETANAKTQVTTVGGQPCTAEPADWTITKKLSAGIYCAASSITVSADLTDVALVAPTIRLGAVSLTGWSGIPSYGGLLLYAYGDSGGAAVPPVNEVDTVTVTKASGGTFTLTINGQTTSAIAYNATAAAVQTALENLTTIGSGNVSVTGPTSSAQSLTWTVTFVGALAGTNMDVMTADGSNLTGTGNPSAVAATTTDGSPGYTASQVIRQSGNGFTFKGALYAPFGGVQLTGSANSSQCGTAGGCGFIEAQTISLSGAKANYAGLGPTYGGTTIYSTSTSITPGFTITGSTVTIPGTTATVGTGSNLDE